MKPGTTYLPAASMTRVAVAPGNLPIATISSPAMPMSALKAGASRAVEHHAAPYEEVELLGGGRGGGEGERECEGREEGGSYHRTGAG